MKPKISVIIPVYNVEKYLRLCIESIINQTLKEIQIVLVNDGSTDSSLDICELYLRKDNRIQLINKMNGGLSSARNSGLSVAKGQYVSFIDSDDWIDDRMLEDLYTDAIMHDADLVVSGEVIEYVFENYSRIVLSGKTTNTSQKSESAGYVFELCTKGLFSVVWNKLYRNNVVRQNDIKFDVDAMPVEDIIFNASVFCKINSLSILDRAYYHYMKRDENTYVTRYSQKIFEIAKARYSSFVQVFEYYGLDKTEHTDWLDKTYALGLLDCVLNMYRKGSTLDFIGRKSFLRDVIYSDTKAKVVMVSFKPNNIYETIFMLCFRGSSPTLSVLLLDVLFWFRKNLNVLYLKIRKGSNKND